MSHLFEFSNPGHLTGVFLWSYRLSKRSTKQVPKSVRLKEGSVLHEILRRCAKKIINDKQAEFNSQTNTDTQKSAPKLSAKTRHNT